MHHLHRFLPAVIALAERAGRLLADEFARPDRPRGRHSRAPVDSDIEALLRPALLTLLPARWHSEGTNITHDRGSALCWVVNPHDGTQAFLAGERGTAISIALLSEGIPVLGVVHAPLPPDRGPDTIAWAEGMRHILRNSAPVAHELDHTPLAQDRIVVVSHLAAEWPLGSGRAVQPARFVALPSTAYRLARVAAGDGVAAVSTHAPRGRDYAAGHALLRGVGGVLLNEVGGSVTYTPDGASQTLRCFGGAPIAARDLVHRDWDRLNEGRRQGRGITLPWPRHAPALALDRALGCLFGQVAGDSLGSLVTGHSAAEIKRRHPLGLRDLADGGAWAGQPTDDSELALDLARTLAGRSQWCAEAVAGAYAGWYRSRPFDVGNTTIQALAAAARAPQGAVAATARAAANPSCKANRALMRAAPIGLWARNPSEAAAAAREDAALTNPNPLCQAASAAFVAAIASAMAGGDSRAMFDAAEAELQDTGLEELRLSLADARRGMPPEDFEHPQDHVLIAFQNAFHHLALGTSFSEAVIETVAQGGDTDTNAAICGALIGAAQGSAAIPDRWRMAIQACRPIAELGARRPRPARYWPADLTILAEALVQRRA